MTLLKLNNVRNRVFFLRSLWPTPIENNLNVNMTISVMSAQMLEVSLFGGETAARGNACWSMVR